MGRAEWISSTYKPSNELLVDQHTPDISAREGVAAVALLHQLEELSAPVWTREEFEVALGPVARRNLMIVHRPQRSFGVGLVVFPEIHHQTRVEDYAE